VVPVPTTPGQCDASFVPVYRLYNNRFAQNDSNHRFTPSRDAREQMLAAGWRDEGVAFCAYESHAKSHSRT
jgi:serine protease